MKFLLDQGTPRSAADLLRRVGIDAVHTGEIGLATAEDSAIIERGSAEDRMIVTLDADFHAQLALVHATKPSVIRIRIEGLRGEELVQLLQNVMRRCEDDLKTGAMISVTEHQIRVRRLPVV